MSILTSELIEETPTYQWMPASQCLEEVTQGIGPGWRDLPLYGASRAGISAAKEAIGKRPERYKPVAPGTVFYNPMRILLGSIAMVDDDDRGGITSPDYVVVRGRPGILHHRVFYYWLRSTDGEALIRELARGGVRERILFNRLAEGLIPVLKWKVQERLAKQLAIIPRARAAALARIAAAEALPAACLRKVFEGTAATEWESLPVSEICRVVEGQVDPREQEFGLLPHVNGENIESGTGRILKVQSAAEDGLVSGKYLFEPGMVLYSKLRPYLRKVAIAPFRGVCSADMYPLTFDPEHVDTHFALWSLLAGPFSRYAIKESERARMPKLNREQLYAWNMPLPSLNDQRRIAVDLTRQLAESERMTAMLRDELAAIEALPAALLRDAFNGKD